MLISDLKLLKLEGVDFQDLEWIDVDRRISFRQAQRTKFCPLVHNWSRQHSHSALKKNIIFNFC